MVWEAKKRKISGNAIRGSREKHLPSVNPDSGFTGERA
jgi:hypothetical protein